MKKVYCSLCRYCDDDHTSISYYKCYHPKHLTDTFYGKAWDTPYCDKKNRDNNCPDFEAHPRIIRKQKRREWFNSLINKIKDFNLKSLSKVISRFGVTMRNSH